MVVWADLLQSIGSESSTREYIDVYIINGRTGYIISGIVDDEKEFDAYQPILQKMINSIHIQEAKENPENTAFVPETVN